MARIKRNYGTIYVSDRLVNEHPEDLFEIFQQIEFLPIKIIDSDNVVKYMGYSRNFELVKKGEQVPVYEVDVVMTIDGNDDAFIRECDVVKWGYEPTRDNVYNKETRKRKAPVVLERVHNGDEDEDDFDEDDR